VVVDSVEAPVTPVDDREGASGDEAAGPTSEGASGDEAAGLASEGASGDEAAGLASEPGGALGSSAARADAESSTHTAASSCTIRVTFPARPLFKQSHG
jgi:hypothetical protein